MPSRCVKRKFCEFDEFETIFRHNFHSTVNQQYIPFTKENLMGPLGQLFMSVAMICFVITMAILLSPLLLAAAVLKKA